jgi:hypothetical protein
MMVCIPISICVLTEDVEAIQQDKEIVEEKNLFEEFYYRLFIKDTRDFYDYVMLGTFIVGLLIVMVFQNTHYYTVKVEKSTVEMVKEEPKIIVKEDNKRKSSPKKREHNKYQKKIVDKETSLSD